MLTILKKHCEDEDFNVSLYSNLLLENYSSDDSFKYIRNSKSYFDEIPNRGHKLFIKKNRPSPWINGYDCVMEQIELLSERLEVDGEHLEKRVADYCDKIPDTVQDEDNKSCGSSDKGSKGRRKNDDIRNTARIW